MEPSKFINPFLNSSSLERKKLIDLLLKQEGIHVEQEYNIPRRPVTGPLPLSYAQQGVWFIEQLDPSKLSYHVICPIHLTGFVDINTLQNSLNQIVQRHEILRTIFVSTDGQPTQVILPALYVPLHVTDHSHVCESERITTVKEHLDERSRQPFDLVKGPLLRADIIQFADSDHWLVVIMHHLVSDGWSTKILVNEIVTLYNALATGLSTQIPDLPVQYADFTLWQRERLQGPILEKLLEYWKRQLIDIPTYLDLPTDYPRPIIQVFREAIYSFPFPNSLYSAIDELGRQERCTLFMTMLAVYQTLLHRYTDQIDILVGSPVAGRIHRQLEDAIGLFTTTLIFRANFGGNPSFREMLHQVRIMTLEAYENQELPFELLVATLHPERHTSHNPLAQVAFQMHTPSSESLNLQNSLRVSQESFHIPSGTAKFELTLTVVNLGDRMQGYLHYNAAIFDESTIIKMANHLQTLMEGIISNPDRSVSTLPMLANSEQKIILDDWNRTNVKYSNLQCLHHAIEAQTHKTPDNIAVVYNQTRLNFDELDRRANQLAHYLHSIGVGPEVVVGICMQRSVDLLVALLGVLKAGGAYLPIEPTFPMHRIKFMLRDAQAPLVITQESLNNERWSDIESKGQFDSTYSLSIIQIDSDWGVISAYPDTPFESGVVIDNLAYVIYTSGSTNRPKGVMITHRGLTNYLSWCVVAYKMANGTGAFVHSSIAFDLTVTSLFAPLLTGKTVNLLDEGKGIEALIIALSEDHNFGLVKITPAHLKLLGRHIAANAVVNQNTIFVIGGENLLPEHIQFWQDKVPDSTLFNEYGPTETVVGCCVFRVPQDYLRTGSIPIGKPIANTQLYVLDRHMQVVPTGVPGELYVGGAGVARGYLNRADLTAERFVPNPFLQEKLITSTDLSSSSNFAYTQSARLYRTGDLVRYRSNGDLEFIGRIDNQVKIRGFRVEIGEIEATLTQHPEIQDAIVVLRKDRSSSAYLVAYIVARTKPAPTNTTIRDFLKLYLPSYMIPSVYVQLEILPLSANGKINREALPSPDFNQPPLEHTHNAPSTETERIISTIWRSVLGINEIDIQANFFDIGGHSILLLEIQTNINNMFAANVSIVDMFRYSTIYALAKYVDHHDRGKETLATNTQLAKSFKSSAIRQRKRRKSDSA